MDEPACGFAERALREAKPTPGTKPQLRTKPKLETKPILNPSLDPRPEPRDGTRTRLAKPSRHPAPPPKAK